MWSSPQGCSYSYVSHFPRWILFCSCALSSLLTSFSLGDLSSKICHVPHLVPLGWELFSKTPVSSFPSHTNQVAWDHILISFFLSISFDASLHYLLLSFPSSNSLDIPRSREAKAEVSDVDFVGLGQMSFLLGKEVEKQRGDKKPDLPGWWPDIFFPRQAFLRTDTVGTWQANGFQRETTSVSSKVTKSTCDEVRPGAPLQALLSIPALPFQCEPYTSSSGCKTSGSYWRGDFPHQLLCLSLLSLFILVKENTLSSTILCSHVMRCCSW